MEEASVLITRAQKRDKDARDYLIQSNLGLIHHIIKRFQGRGAEMEDLFQIGSIGLMKAIDKFDLSFDVKFSTYAVPMIQGEIKRFLRDDGMLKISRNIKENSWKIRRAKEQLFQKLGREATMLELEKETGFDEEEILLAMDAVSEVESIYKSVMQTDGSELYLVDRIPSKLDEGEELIDRLLLEELMKQLTPIERELISLRYFEDKTQMEVAGRLGISQVQVSRLEKKILMRKIACP